MQSHPILHNSGRRKSGDEAQLPTLDEPQESDLPDPGSGTGPLADGATPGEQNLNRQATGVKVREFTWDSNTALPFVVVFSHAAVTVTLRDRVLASLQPVVAQGSIAVSDLPQGKSTQTLTMKKGGKEVCSFHLMHEYVVHSSMMFAQNRDAAPPCHSCNDGLPNQYMCVCMESSAVSCCRITVA